MAEAANIGQLTEAWVKASYVTAAVVAAVGGWLFVSAAVSSTDDNANPAWTVYLGTFIGLASVTALISATTRGGAPRAVCRGATTGAAASFVLLGALSIGVLFVPLALWLGMSTFGGRQPLRDRPEATLAACAVAFLIPLVGVLTVYRL